MGPESVGVWVPILSSASLSGRTCWSSSELTSSGNTHSIRRLGEPKYDCSSPASSGPAITPAAQYGVGGDPWNWRSAARMPGSMPQNDESGSDRDHDSRDQDGDLSDRAGRGSLGAGEHERGARVQAQRCRRLTGHDDLKRRGRPFGRPACRCRPRPGNGGGYREAPAQQPHCGPSGCRSVISTLTARAAGAGQITFMW